MELITKNGVKFLIDDEDFNLIKNINWSCTSNNYIRGWCSKTKKDIRLHRIIMNVLNNNNKLIDHKNRNTLDNRKINLRICNASENQKNKKPSGKCKYLGVSIHQIKRERITKEGFVKFYISKPRFLSKIKVNNKQIHLGLFDNEIDAAIKYNEAAIIYHGEFANLNSFS